jgi:DNA-binding transcriptional MerR regulator/effector-binding domain-containing protein
MFSIGDFASLGRVSVRMLRHYDAIGLLRPARVDERNGYRYYQAEQLRRLNRLVALQDLGFTLEQVRDIVDAKVEPAELRGMLRLRRAEVANQIAAHADRLTRIEARLRIIEREGTMSTQDVVVKKVEPLQIISVSGVAPSSNSQDVGPVVGPLCAELSDAMAGAALQPTGPAVATYAPADQGRLAVTVGCPVGSLSAVESLRFENLPGMPAAACYTHRGSMDTIGEGYQTLATWIEDHGYRTDGTAREVYLISHPEPEGNWMTELQMPISSS